MFALSPQVPPIPAFEMPDLLSVLEAGELIRRKRKEKGLTQEQVAEQLNLNNPNYLGMMETGKVGLARSKYLQPLAQLLGLTVEEVRQINPDAIVEVAATPLPPVPPTNVHRVPVLALVACGEGIYTDCPPVGMEYVLDDLYRNNMEIVEIRGDSMAPTIEEGDLAYIDRGQTDLVDGKIYLVHILTNGYVLKRARKLGRSWVLMSDNPDHPALSPEEARVAGRMYYHQPRGRMM